MQGLRSGPCTAVIENSRISSGLSRHKRNLVAANVRSAAGGFAAIAAVGFADGGYFERAWGFALLAFAAVVALVFLFREDVVVGPLEWISLAALGGLVCWTFASGAWGIDGTEAAREAERTLMYLGGLGMFLVLVDAASVAGLLAGVLGATVALCAYGLTDRFLGGPTRDPFEGLLLFEPVGYANALGILAALGLVLAAGALLWGQRRREVWGLAMAAAVILGVALALTSSRGAVLSLACGLLVLAIAYPRPSRRWGEWTALGAACAVVVFAWLGVASESGLGDRPAFWRAAVADARAHPVTGSGAGSFDDYWAVHRSRSVSVQDAHSLYLESFAELGPLGLILVLGVLVPPLVAGVLARSDPLVAVAAGGYSAFLVHLGLDWDWEMPVTTVAGLACGAALLAAARPVTRTLSMRERATGVAAALGLCMLALIVLLVWP
jgi:O-Antigen ligase